MTKNKHLPKLVSAAAMLTLSAAMLSTASYAWFSMNTKVTATGMEMTATTPVNLLINNANGGAFGNSVTADEAFGTGKLYPSSSADAVKFNAIENSGNYIGTNGIGGVADAATKFQKGSNQPSSKVVALANNTDGYWATYTYSVKLSQAQTNAAKVYLSELNIFVPYVADGSETGVAADTYYTTSSGTTAIAAGSNLVAETTYFVKNTGIANAVRVAMVVASDAAGAAKKVIYAVDGTAADAVTADITADGTVFDGLATTTVTPVAIYDAGTADANCFAVNGDAINVNLVVWIEGQDADCVNAVAGTTFGIAVAFDVKVS